MFSDRNQGELFAFNLGVSLGLAIALYGQREEKDNLMPIAEQMFYEFILA